MIDLTGFKIDYTLFSKYHAGSRQISPGVLQPIVDTLAVHNIHISQADLLAIEHGGLASFGEEISPWVPKEKDIPGKTNEPLTQFYWQINNNFLDEIGILKGDILLFDMSPDAFKNLKNGDVVIIQKYGENLADTRTLVRQYIPPNLFITNSAFENLPSLHGLKDDIQIKGIMISSHRLKN